METVWKVQLILFPFFNIWVLKGGKIFQMLDYKILTLKPGFLFKHKQAQIFEHKILCV